MILLSAFMWSVLPLYSVWTDGVSIVSIMLYAHLTASAFVIFAPRHVWRVAREGVRHHRSLLFLASLLPFLTQAFFVVAVWFIPPTHATFLLELYPIIMMILVPIVLKSQNLTAPSSIKFIAFPLAAAGLIIVIVSIAQVQGAELQTENLIALSLGTLAALAAAVCSSLGVLKTLLANKIYEGDLDARGQVGVLVITRALPVPFLLAATLYFDLPLSGWDVILPGIFIGACALALADFFGNHGLRLAKSVGPVIVFYYAPLLGATWLVVFFDYPMPDGLLIGAMFIIVANAYSNLHIRRFSLVVTLFTALLYAVFTLSFEFSGIGTGEALTLILVFFSILSAAVLTRVHHRLIEVTNFIADICFEKGVEARGSNLDAWADSVALEPRERHSLKKLVRSDRLFSDILIMIGLGVAVVLAGLLYGNNGAVQIIVSFSVVIGSVFVVASSIELTTDRFLLGNAREVLRGEKEPAEFTSFAFSIVAIALLLAASIGLN